MLEPILPFLRCPRCTGTSLRSRSYGVHCSNCRSDYPLAQGILDMTAGGAEVITPFQRVMQAPVVVSVYERFWRPFGYYTASSRPFSEEIRTVLRLQQDADQTRLLDLACGTGVFTRPLARRSSGTVVGLDLSSPMLRRARRLAMEEGLANVIFIRASAFKLPFIAGTFSAINCCGALHLFDQPDLALREVKRVLLPGGHLSIQTTIRPSHSAGLAYFMERFIRFGFFDEQQLKEKIRLHGFHILESERHRISYTLLARHT